MTVAGAADVDARRLAIDLLNRVDGEVRFDAGARALYSADASTYRHVPLGVVIPRTVDALVEAVATIAEHGAPMLPRGAGTGLAGQSTTRGVVLDCSKYLRRIHDIDPDRGTARVEPGVPLDDLRRAARPYDLTFGPDPATHQYCTLGGMIGNNSCGIHSIQAGRTLDNVESLEVLTADGHRMRLGPTDDATYGHVVAEGGRPGRIYQELRKLAEEHADEIRRRTPADVRRLVSGYRLEQLLPESDFNLARAIVGTEATCVVILGATLRLIDRPRARSLLVIGYPDVFRAADDVPRLRSMGPIGLEGLDDRLRDDARAKGLHADKLRLLPDAGGWLIAEFGGRDQAEAHEGAAAVREEIEGEPGITVRHYDDPREQESVFEVRESGLGATAKVPGEPDTWPGWEDSAVPPEELGAYLRALRGLLDGYGYDADFYGHFGDGCLHTRIPFDLRTDDGVRRYRSFVEQAADLVVSHGGSLSGEHGDGQARAELLGRMYGERMVGAFDRFKDIWDPDGLMNPGRVVHPRRLDDDLRNGPDWQPIELPTKFAYEENGFADAADRCVGVGKCRRTEEGTMCPSYQVTREELHSTRGRARALFEMARGEVITDGWKSDEVMDALHLCLSCKACLSECPVEVDMATYKAEFLSHYYEGRLRPRNAYVFGLIMRWARLAELAPWMANMATQTPGLAWISKRVAGIAPNRQIPAFARETFRQWFRRHRSAAGTGRTGRTGRTGEDAATSRRRVILWPDTFNDHFHPQTARAALEVLEGAGCEVVLPERRVCCGRPLYEYGMIDRARRLLADVLDTLREDLRAGTPVVVLEPSCASVFRVELPRLFPGDDDARRLSEQSLLLGEYLDRIDHRPAPDGRGAVVHGHCHQTAVMGMESEAALLSRAGYSADVLDSGCCGMAGSFGFEAGERYEVSIAAGERVLMPAVRSAPDTMAIVTDGYSCREQIAQRSGRRALHLAEALRLAEEKATGVPEQHFADEPATWRDAVRPLLVGALLVTAATALANRAGKRLAR